ncbi:DUF6252 family protein [Jejudonia soesokkakensis]|uniref:DUF6252 family protein n=1 Tax=Jejudonia soesokkakensis TaxID=1323432 RepID=A0ABW2MUJ9_9FLAO
MKINKLLLLPLLFVSLVFFTACDNEPLEGTFITEVVVEAEPGEFVCMTGEVDFFAETISATFFSDGRFVISGQNTEGESIAMQVADGGLGGFNLTQGGASINGAVYIASGDPVPFTTAVSLGGSGTLNISLFDTDAQLVSGTFDFTAARPLLDDNGDPMVDDDGNVLSETIEISNGSFAEIPFTIEEGTGMPSDNFGCDVNTNNFDIIELDVDRVVIADVPVIKILATSSTGATVRLDIPEAIGVGTFEMVQISDGTELIGIYKAGPSETSLSSNPGTITITTLDLETGELVASFEFTATDPLETDPTIVEISNGFITVDYLEEDPMP